MAKSTGEVKKQWRVIRPPLGPDFELPSREELLDVKPGDDVKLIFQAGDDAAERMWVLVKQCDDSDNWVGTLDNNPAQDFTASVLKYEQQIDFHPLDIINIDPPKFSGTKDVGEQLITGDLSQVENTVNKKWYKNPHIVVPALISLFVGLVSAIATLGAALISNNK